MASRHLPVQSATEPDEAREEVTRLNKKVNELTRSLENAECTIKLWKETAAARSDMLKEKNVELEKLKKRIAQMKGSKKIQEEVLALKAKRADAEKKIEEKIAALRVKHAEVRMETDKELGEREKELEMAGGIQ